MTNVRCIDCGLLAMRDRATREIVEVDGSVREFREIRSVSVRNPSIPAAFHGGHQEAELILKPICIARKLQYEQTKTHLNLSTEKLFEIITEERKCDGFIEWHPTFSPKEHAEMMMSERVFQLQEQAAIARDERERAWKATEEKYRRWELAAVIVFAPLMAWLIPYLLTPRTQPAPPPVVNIVIDPTNLPADANRPSNR